MQSSDSSRPPWNLFDLPIVIWGADKVPVRIRGPILLLCCGLAGVLIGGIMDRFDQSMDPDSVASIAMFAIGTFLALISIVAVFSGFVHRELLRRSDGFHETIKSIGDKLGLRSDELNDPRAPRAVATLDDNPSYRLAWISSHRFVQAQSVLDGYMRHSMERLVIITSWLVLPMLFILPTLQWSAQINQFAVGILAFVTLFAAWTVVEAFNYILGSHHVAYDPQWLLPVVDGKYSVITWPYLGRRPH